MLKNAAGNSIEMFIDGNVFNSLFFRGQQLC